MLTITSDQGNERGHTLHQEAWQKGFPRGRLRQEPVERASFCMLHIVMEAALVYEAATPAVGGRGLSRSTKKEAAPS